MKLLNKIFKKLKISKKNRRPDSSSSSSMLRQNFGLIMSILGPFKIQREGLLETKMMTIFLARWA
ncbi:LOW QUALITY PROTEIN: hypothetical protein TorRG33x02_177150 [Trema orientale]|uniref:Uncharacterized protein n=1 Tax=Trema orientale TaxID=63057 RepID=A0A2P5ELV9_TREOI|nr:LOW QUALITY PROTEIN: hypothetical protein TorRG33x02_177150 [Trema orientale]